MTVLALDDSFAVEQRVRSWAGGVPDRVLPGLVAAASAAVGLVLWRRRHRAGSAAPGPETGADAG
ncbi:hypothetical protein AMK16_17230 [Streptomyces sp. CB00455]|uniref:hypothetical protein n=1 Tax=Streptomyces sp. CB00455 TaxID=1703927 RepID=UPI00093CFEAD|nr:hypothetical protein [Streptomyces sp. CB00455]OKK18113.1 hypothetical protein AMK16_17230 [Streptomyces sp. CB00455]